MSQNDKLDAALFRFWIDMAARHPARLARQLANCVDSGQYRLALIALAKEMNVNLPSGE